MDTQDDVELWQRIRAGSSDALASLFSRHAVQPREQNGPSKKSER